MRKLSFVLLLIVFVIAAANSGASAGEDDTLEPASKKDIRQICRPAVEAFRKMIEEELPLRYEQEQADIHLLAEIMYHENWSTDKDHKAAYYTGAVILNRVTSKEFPDTIRGVIYQTKPCKQYAVTDKIGTKELPQECIDMAADLIRNGAPDVPENVVYQATFYQGSGLWKNINGEKFCFE